MNILHASTDPTLLDRLKQMLSSSARADIAVGYFFINGFETIAEPISQLQKVRILVGRTDRHVLEEVALGIQQSQPLHARLELDSLVKKGDRAAIAQQSVERIAEGVAVMPQAKESQEAVSKLRELVLSGRVEVRSYLKSPLHAKAYLCWYENHAEPGAAVVGSSNLTLAGFTGNTELNVRVTGDAEMEALRKWFDDLWRSSEDISSALVSELDRSWVLAKTPPYHVYLKALYELYYTELGSGPLPLPPRSEELANFQLDAVSRALAMIEAHGGCYVGDVVGLGKTYVGAELLRQLRVSYPNDGPPLILCPAGLIPMWKKFNEMFGIGAAVVSHSMIAPPPETEFDEELGRYVDVDQPQQGIVLENEYPNRGPVLVDEAHNFRNINNRSLGLRHYLDSGEHKVVLLSATPQNLGPMDIYRQLALFMDDTEHGLNVEPVSLSEYFRNAQKWLAYRAEYENYTSEYDAWWANSSKGAPPLPPGKPDVPRAEIQEVLSPIFIRRRRKDIQDLYGESAQVNGKPVRFPEPRLDNVAYRLDKGYAKAGSLEELERDLGRHSGVRYLASRYLKEDAKKNPRYRDLLRAKDRIAGLMGVLLLKRLESSIAAFRSTLSTLMTSNRNFREALSKGYVPVGSTATRILSGQSFDVDDLLEILRQEEEKREKLRSKSGKLVYETVDFNVNAWIDDLDADFKVLEEIFRRVEGIVPDDDDKLAALRDFLDQPEVRTGKVLIFSEAETTIEYLYQQLNPGSRESTIASLSGGSGDAERIIKRFSPKSNLSKRESIPGPEIRILLATDIVSEGQNLQDCARVLNYDLHWNPVRIIQRFGRVDRIGTEHTVINLHNMWPDKEVDAQLSLTEKLHNRIQSFHDLIGLDSKLLSDAERLNVSAMYRIYQDKQLPEIDDGLDEIAANQRAITLLQRIQSEDPELWQTITNLPDGIRSALSVTSPETTVENDHYAQSVLEVEGAQPPLVSPEVLESIPSPFDEPRKDETLVLLGAGEVRGCYAVSNDLEPRPISPAQFIAAAECGPKTANMPLPQNTNDRVMAAFETFRGDFQRRLGKVRKPRDTRARRYISKQLSIAMQSAGDNKADLDRIEVLRRIFLGELSPQVESALGEIRNLHLEGSILRARLEALRERYRLNPPNNSDQQQIQDLHVVRIVCSDGLV